MTSKVKWTAIVLTCPNREWTVTLQKELELRQAKGYIDKDVFLLTVEDPKTDVGSGGATINALLTVAEYISAQRGYTVLNTEVLQDSKILILHNGRSYAYDSCGRPFTILPAQFTGLEHDGLVSTMDILVKVLTEKLAVRSGPGMWVSSMDMILELPHDAVIQWEECDACAITVPSTPSYCRQHGVYKLDEQGYIEDIVYKQTLEKLEPCERKDGSVPMVVGIVYFSAAVSETLLTFFTKPPLDACTYFGVDSGEPPIKLSLFFDVMLPMCSGVNARDFRSGARSGMYGKGRATGEMADIKTMRAARTILWDDLQKYKIKACMLEDGSCVYPHTIQEHKKNLLDRRLEPCCSPGQLTWSTHTHAHVMNVDKVDESSVIINSVLHEKVSVGPRCVVSHSHIQGKVAIGKDSFVSGLVMQTKPKESVQFAESIIVQCYNVYVPFLDKTMYVMTTHGRFDNIEMPMWKTTGSFCNDPWGYLLNRTGIIKEDLWGTDVENDDQTIHTAQLFPVFHAREAVGLTEILWLQGEITDTDDKQILRRWKSSWRLSLKDIQELINLETEFESRRKLFYTVAEYDIRKALQNQENKGFRALYNSAVVDGFTNQLFTVLDDVCDKSADQLKAGTAARTLANIADLLGCMAGPKGGLRSGPAANKAWSKAFQLLEKHEIRRGVALLSEERGKWLDRPDKLIRAARHYEGAAQILIRHAVMTAKQYFKPTDGPLPGLGHWTLVECPARIDVSGGWSDTPPITYEHGGAVTMVALLINGKRAIGAKCRRIIEPKLVLVIHGSSEQKEVVCKELSDLADYFQPHSPGALLKAAFVCADIVDVNSDRSLEDQLSSKYSGGFELHSWANLPQGSGLGTSSILAGAVMAALLKAAGKSCDTQGLIHAVLYLEQLLTTGGGWQDQIGGLAGGIHLGVSAPGLPLFVEARDLNIAPDIIQAFNDRLVLIYTGKTRLARNLLQDVVRNWYARNPQIVDTEDNLVKLGNECAQYFQQGDLESVGRCLDSYWNMKKLMAPGCEPEFVTRLMRALRPHALGMCMAGAGGGGFMYVLARDPESKMNIRNMLGSLEVEGACIYEAVVDTEGMTVTMIEADGESQSSNVSELEEDMHHYYNQPETLLDEVKPSTGDLGTVPAMMQSLMATENSAGDGAVQVDNRGGGDGDREQSEKFSPGAEGSAVKSAGDKGERSSSKDGPSGGIGSEEERANAAKLLNAMESATADLLSAMENSSALLGSIENSADDEDVSSSDTEISDDESSSATVEAQPGEQK